MDSATRAIVPPPPEAPRRLRIDRNAVVVMSGAEGDAGRREQQQQQQQQQQEEEEGEEEEGTAERGGAEDEGAEENPDGVVGVDRSGQSAEECYVRFVNTTQRAVKLVWLDDKGRRVPRRTLSAQTAHSVFTYRTHPWIFLDAETGERLAAKRGPRARSGFFESGDHLRALRSSGECSEERARQLEEGRGLICVFIQPAVDGLRTLALRTVRRTLQRKEDCFCLDVPQKVQFELAQMFM